MTEEICGLYCRYTLVDDACIYLPFSCFYHTLRIVVFAENESMNELWMIRWMGCDPMKGGG
jgi:hypothetical protein